MSFIIRNTSAGSVLINDLGINLTAPGDEHDLSQEPANDIAISSDLSFNITAGNIIVLDPLDGITPLTIAESLDLIAASNDPHYRIRGGTLNQINDVSLTNPSLNDILQFDGTSFVNVPGSSAITKSHLSRHNGTVTQTFSGTPVTLNFGVSLRNDPTYVHNVVVGGSEITVTVAGWYKISFDASADNTTNTRRSSHAEMEINNVPVAGTRAHGYHRNVTVGETTFTCTTKQQLNAGDIIRVRILGQGSLVTIANSCRLNIEQID